MTWQRVSAWRRYTARGWHWRPRVYPGVNGVKTWLFIWGYWGAEYLKPGGDK